MPTESYAQNECRKYIFIHKMNARSPENAKQPDLQWMSLFIAGALD